MSGLVLLLGLKHPYLFVGLYAVIDIIRAIISIDMLIVEVFF